MKKISWAEASMQPQQLTDAEKAIIDKSQKPKIKSLEMPQYKEKEKQIRK